MITILSVIKFIFLRTFGLMLLIVLLLSPIIRNKSSKESNKISLELNTIIVLDAMLNMSDSEYGTTINI